MALTLMYITNDPRIALLAEKNGVDRVWIDLETLGKEQRQKGMNTVKSKHCIADISKIKPLLSTAQMLVRVNPINPNSKQEIDAVIEAGADMIMLPMWKSLEDVKQFLNLVNHRVKTTLLLETKEAVNIVDSVLENGGFDEIHIGLNDLHLSYDMTFMFELLTNGIVESLCNKFKKAQIPYGFGGIAKIGAGMLPSEKIIMEHYRLGSTRAILSRSFCDSGADKNFAEIETEFSKSMEELKNFEKIIPSLTINDFNKNTEDIKCIVNDIVKNKGQK